jgi:hypothetical protein
VRITAKAATADAAEALLQPLEADLRRRLGDFIYATGQLEIEDVVADLLAERNQTAAAVEAGTAGDVALRMARVPIAAQVFRGGTLAGAAATAADLAATARQMADWGIGVRVDMNADPPLLEIALAGTQGVETQTLGFGGHPALAVRWVGTAALNLLRLKLIR